MVDNRCCPLSGIPRVSLPQRSQHNNHQESREKSNHEPLHYSETDFSSLLTLNLTQSQSLSSLIQPQLWFDGGEFTIHSLLPTVPVIPDIQTIQVITNTKQVSVMAQEVVPRRKWKLHLVQRLESRWGRRKRSQERERVGNGTVSVAITLSPPGSCNLSPPWANVSYVEEVQW